MYSNRLCLWWYCSSILLSSTKFSQYPEMMMQTSMPISGRLTVLCIKACLCLAQCLNSTGWKGPSANIVKSFSKFRWHIYYPNDKAGYWLAAVSRLIWLHPPCRCLQTARTCVPAADQTLWRSGAPCYHPTITITEKALLETMVSRWEIRTPTQRS